MTALSAVVPERLGGVRDGDHEGLGGGPVRAGNVAGPETARHWLAGRGECGLGHRVVLGPELERDSVALCSLDVARAKSKGVVANNDDVVGRKGGAQKGGGSSSDGETHYELL